jgi:hypothetical protein
MRLAALPWVLDAKNTENHFIRQMFLVKIASA